MCYMSKSTLLGGFILDCLRADHKLINSFFLRNLVRILSNFSHFHKDLREKLRRKLPNLASPVASYCQVGFIVQMETRKCKAPLNVDQFYIAHTFSDAKTTTLIIHKISIRRAANYGNTHLPSSVGYRLCIHRSAPKFLKATPSLSFASLLFARLLLQVSDHSWLIC